jgi:hypothetical protein
MEFTLVYQGRLPANGSPKEKQKIRRIFHSQLKELFKHTPYNLDPPPSRSIRRVGNYTFFPLVTERRREIAELNIMMLRPEPSGYIVSKGGDIDNRLKTLLDSLRMPDKNQIPKNDVVAKGEDPVFCLLEDDSLISKLSVSTDHLLQLSKDKSFVNLMIRVHIKRIEPEWENIFA